MASTAFRGIGRPLAALAAVAALLMGVGVASAAAAPEITTVTPSTIDNEAFPELVEVDVAGEGFEGYEASALQVGICAMPPIEGVPPCGAFAGDVTVESGALGATIELESAEIANDHFGVTPGQPATFTCGESNCGVLVANHLAGGGQEVLDFQALPFEP